VATGIAIFEYIFPPEYPIYIAITRLVEGAGFTGNASVLLNDNAIKILFNFMAVACHIK
jgi:hypothetical protein